MAKSDVVDHWRVPENAIWNIGQIDAARKMDLESGVRKGRFRKVRSSWMGISPLKTVYIPVAEGDVPAEP